MSDCMFCEVEKECGYEYKPCDCVHQRKFKAKVIPIAEKKEEKAHKAVIRRAESLDWGR